MWVHPVWRGELFREAAAGVHKKTSRSASGGFEKKSSVRLGGGFFLGGFGFRGTLNGIFGDDFEFEIVGNAAVEFDVGEVLAESFDGAVRQVYLFAVQLNAVFCKLSEQVSHGDCAEHFPAFAGFDSKDDGDALDFTENALRGFEFLGLAHGAGFLQGLDVFAVGAINGKRDALRQEIVAGEAGADLDLVAFGAEVFHGLEKQYFRESQCVGVLVCF